MGFVRQSIWSATGPQAKSHWSEYVALDMEVFCLCPDEYPVICAEVLGIMASMTLLGRDSWEKGSGHRCSYCGDI